MLCFVFLKTHFNFLSSGVTLLNLNGIAENGRDVSNTAKDDGKLILKEVTESAVEALRERREKREE